jgi:hypothetical protein
MGGFFVPRDASTALGNAANIARQKETKNSDRCDTAQIADFGGHSVDGHRTLCFAPSAEIREIVLGTKRTSPLG